MTTLLFYVYIYCNCQSEDVNIYSMWVYYYNLFMDIFYTLCEQVYIYLGSIILLWTSTECASMHVYLQ